MNERIEKLFGQASDQAVPETWTALTPAQLSKLKDKFAELIVRECAELCEGEAIFAGMNGRKDASASNCATTIRNHFGVDQ